MRVEIHQRPGNEGFSATQPPRFPSRVFLFSLRALGKSGPVFPSASPPNLRKALGKGQISSFLSRLCRQHLSSLTEINLVCERGDKLKGRETQEGPECWSSSFFLGGRLWDQHLFPICPFAHSVLWPFNVSAFGVDEAEPTFTWSADLLGHNCAVCRTGATPSPQPPALPGRLWLSCSHVSVGSRAGWAAVQG